MTTDSACPVDSGSSRNRQVPAWLLSVALHSLIVVTLAATYRFAPRGVAASPDRTTGIVLVKHAQGEREYFDEDDLQAAETVKDGSVGVQSPMPGADELAIDLSELLASDSEGVGSVAESKSSAPRAGELGGGTAEGMKVGGSARTGVFGVYGEGTRFVYVFDRSGSMGGFGGRPLRAAKRELTASVGDLGRVHQFQIIFYNEKPRVFNPDGGRPKLEWADEAGKELASAFLRTIEAAGGTSHMGALRIAIGLSPDVIFFLTDADEPRLSAADLAQIRRTNGGTAIHAVEFGFGPRRSRSNFLVRLAEQNGGQHVYVDISKLPRHP